MFMHKAALVLTLTALAAGCGGGSDEAVDPEAIEGTWTYELTRQYMLDNGISEQQAKNKSGSTRPCFGTATSATHGGPPRA